MANIQITEGSGTTLKTTETNNVHVPHHNVDNLPNSYGVSDGDNVALGARSDSSNVDHATTGTLLAFLKGLVRILASVWDSVNNRLNTYVEGGSVEVTTLPGVSGNQAHDSVDSGNPIKVGGKAADAEPAAVADGDRVDAYFDTYGRQHVINDGALERIKDTMSVALATDALMHNMTPLTPKYASIWASSVGSSTIVPAVVGKKIRVLNYTFVARNATEATFKSGLGGTAITGPMAFAERGGASVGFSPHGHFETAVGEALTITVSAADLAGHITYVEI